MRPFAAELSVHCMAQFAVLRHSPALAAARAHVRHLRSTRCWSFESHATLAPWEPFGSEALADSPAALSDELVALLFGRHPRTRQPPREAGLTVTEVGWDEWLRCGGAPRG